MSSSFKSPAVFEVVVAEDEENKSSSAICFANIFLEVDDFPKISSKVSSLPRLSLFSLRMTITLDVNLYHQLP